MWQETLDGVDLSRLRAEYDRKVHDALPAQARASEDWPIHADHCFARVVLDNLFQDVWYDHVEGRPAYSQSVIPHTPVTSTAAVTPCFSKCQAHSRA